MTDTIFVSIANYRDPQILPTVRDLIQKAKHPERLRIGVFSQIDVVDENYLQKDERYSQVREDVIPFNQSMGVCWARSRIFNKLMADERFVLQIDSHSRFAQDWDATLLKMYYEHGDDKAVYSHYPTDYRPDEPLGDLTYTYHCVKGFAENGLPIISSGMRTLANAPTAPQPNAVIAGGSLFTRTDTIRQVPYDPHLYFIGEEITYAIRLFTHGFNIYTPHVPFMYHQYMFYTRPQRESEKRKKHWEDNRDWSKINALSMKRIKHLLEIEPCTDPKALLNFMDYQKGDVRTIEDWQQFSGVNLKMRTVSHQATLGQFGV